MSIPLIPGTVSPSTESRFPHLAGLPAWKIPDVELDRVPEWLRGQVAVAAADESGRIVDATGLQIPGVLDDLYIYAGPLGPVWEGSSPHLYLWAPTAQKVQLLLFENSQSDAPVEVVPMERGAEADEPGASGVWRVEGRPDWKEKFYLFEVEVFAPSTGRIEVEAVTDPYSRSLSTNSQRSQFVHLDDPALQPDGWNSQSNPTLDSFTDIVLYELHVRDFSVLDDATPEAQRGTYLAFAADAPPTRHLRRLRAAGVTHVHLLPVFDIATVDEDRSNWPPLPDLSGYAPDSEEQQAQLAGFRRVDGFNWGYDPFHFGVPEGCYSTEPDGATRILEFRTMVRALHEMGLRVVMDVVYNHTHGSGRDPYSVFDRIVPGYFHRLDENGTVHTSTCCENTASEHAMFARFVGDDLEHWARDYKIDGFRFDLMGHHMKANLEDWRDRLRALSLQNDGVDGSKIYLYGEGWDFGEVQGGKRGVNASQTQLAGTGIGTFNDRLRDAVRGGNPFGDRREQGFATGLFTAPAFNGGGEAERARLLELQDKIRVGLAGNLADYRFTRRDGRETKGSAVSGTGYAQQPCESIQYVSAHDNETLFDKVQYVAPETTPLAERVRMSTVALSTVAFAQGVLFFHAGSEILRSKSFDADSYDSGDWFNRLDFTYLQNAFGHGLPPAEKNQDRWDMIRPILGRADLKPGREEIESALLQFETFLRIRGSSPLFRLQSLEEIQARVRFHNTGPTQIPGLIAMSLRDEVDSCRSDGSPFELLDGNYRMLVVLINAHPKARSFRHPGLVGRTFELHPFQADGSDEVVRSASFNAEQGSLNVPGRTTAVFVEPSRF
jgi:pullulanase-type alpha-1,6-glucosidase